MASPFRKAAESLQSEIDRKLAPRLVNTHKRAREWESAIAQGLRLQKLQSKLEALAEAYETNQLPLVLQAIKYKNQVERLTFYPDPPGPTSPDWSTLKQAGISTPEQYREAYEALAAMGDPKAGEETPEIQIRRKEIEADNSRIPSYFPTPRPVIDRMLSLVKIEAGSRVLEPSAGKGSIAEAIRAEHPEATIHVVEWNRTLREILDLKNFTVIAGDIFSELLDADYYRYDVILMNPPFEKGADWQHVRRCFDLLKPGGQLVAVMAESAFFNKSFQYDAFREWLPEYGYDIKLPDGSFANADRSTGVSTRLIYVEKPGTPEAESPAPPAPEIPEQPTAPEPETPPQPATTYGDPRETIKKMMQAERDIASTMDRILALLRETPAFASAHTEPDGTCPYMIENHYPLDMDWLDGALWQQKYPLLRRDDVVELIPFQNRMAVITEATPYTLTVRLLHDNTAMQIRRQDVVLRVLPEAPEPAENPAEKMLSAEALTTAFEGLQSRISDVFNRMEWIEAQIKHRMNAFPHRAAHLYDCFKFGYDGFRESIIESNRTLWEAHITELLDRVVNDEDLDDATEPEMLCAMAGVSNKVPMHGDSAALYWRLFAKLLPDVVERWRDDEGPTGIRESYPGATDPLYDDLRRDLHFSKFQRHAPHLKPRPRPDPNIYRRLNDPSADEPAPEPEPVQAPVLITETIPTPPPAPKPAPIPDEPPPQKQLAMF